MVAILSYMKSHCQKHARRKLITVVCLKFKLVYTEAYRVKINNTGWSNFKDVEKTFADIDGRAK